MTRKTVSLNGMWDFCPLYDVKCDLSLPENLVYDSRKLRVPSSWRSGPVYRGINTFDINEYAEEWNNAVTGVCRTFFNVSFEDGQRVFLKIDNISQQAAVYINKKHIADWKEMYLPLVIDVTDSITNGKDNELQIVCTSFESCKIPSGAEKTTGLKGSWYGDIARGIWGDISLEILPEIHISDVTVRTSVRKKQLEVITELSCSFDGEIYAEIFDGDISVMRFECVEGSTVREWNNPILWDTENPHLYNIKITLIKDGTVKDELTERFGFREFWHEGPQFMLNGTPINLRGDSWHFQGVIQNTKEYALNWYDICIENGLNSVRLHAEPHPVCYLDAADEKGILIVDETAIYGSGKSMDAANDKFIENCKEHIVRLIKRDKNHPSVVFWSLENEMRWVDGRDTFKLHIPEMIKTMNRLDPTREVSLDGDNRLISYENTQLESLHYNIDGTIAQWRREKPLTIGEHGGMWYLCPQNGSAYTGLEAYDNFVNAAKAFAVKERLFIESARREGVSGISTFNFAYYYTYSMPNEDVYLENGPFKKIPKYSLSINNGLLKGYPKNIPNPMAEIMRESFLPVTVIPREYDFNFYDGKSVSRSFDVYNDTLKQHDCIIEYAYFTENGKIAGGKYEYVQSPAEHVVWETELPHISAEKETKLTLNIKLYHEGELVCEKNFGYNIYPSSIKTQKISVSRKAAFYGDERSYNLVSSLIDCERLGSTEKLDGFELLVLGSYLNDDDISGLEEFVQNGGVLLVLEQSDFALGDLQLQKQSFISAHSGMKNHPILKGLDDKDLMFWKPNTVEGEPEPVIMQNFKKPTNGAYRFILESDMGDYADGGDLWSPLMTVRCKNGEAVMCQLEITEHFDLVPQSCILLKNLLDYCGNLPKVSYKKVGAVGEKATLLLKTLGAELSDEPEILLADVENSDIKELKRFAENGGTVITLPFGKTAAESLSETLYCEITAESAPVCHLKKADLSDITDGISPVDLFRYDKVPMSPRQVSNTLCAENTAEVKGGKTLITDSPNTPWEDYFGKSNSSEMFRIPIVCLNSENPQEPKPYMSEFKLGKGRIILNQLCCDTENEKDMRTYRNLLDNCGAEIDNRLFGYKKTESDYAVDYFMTLPLESWQNEEEARAYYTDPQFSLNNLGEGLYGWMLKVEKDAKSGYITVPNSKGRKYFLTCFADKTGEEETLTAALDSNARLCLYVNGKAVNGKKITLKAGVNRIVIEAENNTDDNLKFRLVFVTSDGKPSKNIRTHLTINEVDPK